MEFKFDTALPVLRRTPPVLTDLNRLVALGLSDEDLSRRGRHPDFGVVTLGQHLSTWVAHDLGHISQIVRVMARQYTDAVGPWRMYLSILNPR
jgi:hypothetical protein